MKQIIRIVTLTLVCALAALGVGCSCASQEQTKTTQDALQVSDVGAPSTGTSTTTQEPAADTDLVIGTKVDGGYTISVVNETGRDITGLQAAESGSDAFGVNLMSSDSVFAQGKTATLNLQPVETPTSEAGIKLRATVDLQVSFADGSKAVVHQLSVTNLKNISFCMQDGILYAQYTVDGVEESTLETERMLAGYTTPAQQ